IERSDAPRLGAQLLDERHDRERVGPRAFGLDPGFLLSGAIWRTPALGDDAFEAEAAPFFVNLLTVAGETFHINKTWRLRVDQCAWAFLAFYKRQAAQILAVQPQQVEGIIGQPFGVFFA